MWYATKVHLHLCWLRFRRARVFWMSVVLFALPLVIICALSAGNFFGRSLFEDGVQIYFGFLIPFLPALLVGPVLSEEFESHTDTFVFARPAPRAALLFGRCLSAFLPMVAVILPSLALMYVVCNIHYARDMAENFPQLLSVEVAAVFAILYFIALAAALGSLAYKHPMVAIVGYIVVVEFGIGGSPFAGQLLSMSYHLHRIADLPVPASYFFSVDLPRFASALIVLVVSALWLTVAAVRIENIEHSGAAS